MTKFYRIKAFGELTSVTVRTLHYYDEIGLLKPTGKSAMGHRIYSEKDLLRLQQITTLKFLGFPLVAIKKIVLNENFDIKYSLEIQAEILYSESERMNKAAKLIQYLLDSLEMNNEIVWEKVTKIIEVMKMSKIERDQWERKYLNKDELQSYEKLVSSRSKEEWKVYHDKWLALLEEVKNNLHNDPGSKMGQTLAEKWIVLVDDIYADYPKLREKMWQAMKAEVMPKDNFPYSHDVIGYMEKATNIFKNKK